MSKVFFIADMHFSHQASIYFDSRPFENIDDMRKQLIERWNKVVTKQDRVYILGDFCWDRNEEDILQLLEELNGSKMIIVGNHDQYTRKQKVRQAFSQFVKDYDEIDVDGRKVVLSHYPIASWKHMQGLKGDTSSSYIHLYGHVHASKEFDLYENYLKQLREVQNIPALAYNVGAMMPWMDYTPRTLDEIITNYNQYQITKGRG